MREHGRLLVSHDTAKSVACETRSEPPPLLASLAVGSTSRAKERVYSHFWTSETSSCVCSFHFYVYEWIRVQKLASFPEKGGIRIIRNSTISVQTHIKKLGCNNLGTTLHACYNLVVRLCIGCEQIVEKLQVRHNLVERL